MRARLNSSTTGSRVHGRIDLHRWCTYCASVFLSAVGRLAERVVEVAAAGQQPEEQAATATPSAEQTAERKRRQRCANWDVDATVTLVNALRAQAESGRVFDSKDSKWADVDATLQKAGIPRDGKQVRVHLLRVKARGVH
jgi:uncharacterized membrane protein YebE (DUF533 family)